MGAKKILVAVRPEDLPLVTGALGPEFCAVVCHTLREAEAALGPDIGMIACGVHFDRGAMFDFLRSAQAHPHARGLPFYLLLGEGSGHSEAVLRGIRSAARLLGATAFTDLSRLRRDLGEQAAYERLRAAVREALTPHETVR